MERRLAAILAADIVGFSHLVQQDEEATLQRLKELQEGLIEPKIREHRGRIVKTTGDGVLAEFSSAIEAVRCAIEIQEHRRLSRNLRKDRKPIELRIGINVGDIVIDGSDVLGDGVNIAARLEGQAEPGGICISGTVFDQVKLAYADQCALIGDLELKNIGQPVRAYKVLAESMSAARQPAAPSGNRSKTKPKIVMMAAAVMVVAVLAASLIWYLNPTRSGMVNQASASTGKVAVLPFKNISNDPDQQFFADGLSEDLITDLSKIEGLPVISSTSSFAFGGANTPLTEIARKLDARYIVEGSVRRHDNALRISAKLVDTVSDSQVWADRFDGTNTDVFVFQDRITAEIIEALKVILTPSQKQAISARGTRNAEAYDAFMRGMRLLSPRRSLDVEANRQAIQAFEEALKHDPDYAQAHAGIGWAHWLHYSTINLFVTERKYAAFDSAEKSLELSETALAHRVLSRKYFSPALHISTTKEPAKAVAELEAALAIEPNNPDLLAELADVLPFAGDPARALEAIQRAIELNPDHPDWYLRPLGIAQLLAGEYAKSSRSLQVWLEQENVFTDYYLWLVVAHSLAGQDEQARTSLKHAWRKTSNAMPTTFYAVDRTWPLPPESRELFHSALRKVGFPEVMIGR